MKACKLCGAALGTPDYFAEPPGLASNLHIIDVKTQVFVCRRCGFAQSPELENSELYYDQDYRISLESAEHDQLITLSSGETLFRNDLQCRIILNNIEIPSGSKVLDFGGAKATTLKKLCEHRSDIVPFVFDVSNDYEASWATWLSKDNTATHVVPDEWHGQFDIIISNFVLEHIAKPVETLSLMRELLAPTGKIFLTVPNALSNSGDLLVVDHVNHFTPNSLSNLFYRCGFALETIDSTQFPGGLMTVAVASDLFQSQEIEDDQAAVISAVTNWARIRRNLMSFAASMPHAPCAIFGAGFYGNWIASLLSASTDIRCFLDNNSYLSNGKTKRLPVLKPCDVPPEIGLIFVGLNPTFARHAIEREEVLRGKQFYFLE